MIYNRKRHVQLLERSQFFKNQGKSFDQENMDDYLELLKYEGIIQSYIYWTSRTFFVLLLEKFVNRLMSGEEFNDNFRQLHQGLIYEFHAFKKKLSSEQLIGFYIDPRSDKFGSLISFLRAECDNFTEDYENEEFYESIKDCFLKLQQTLM